MIKQKVNLETEIFESITDLLKIKSNAKPYI